MIASHDRKKPSCIGKFSFFYLFDPGPIYTYCNIMLAFARRGARMTADAFSIVYDESVFHMKYSLMPYQMLNLPCKIVFTF
jgi:hypothetical protein